MGFAGHLIWDYAVTCGGIKQSYLGAYLKRKGENIATKEDIENITDQVESVRLQYSSQLASIKAEIGSKLHIHQVRYENEYAILTDLAEKLIMLRDAAKALRPEMDYMDPEETEDERRRKRLKQYFDDARKLYYAMETKRPFYPENIYEVLQELDRATWAEAVQYRNRRQSQGQGYDSKYWQQAAENAANISKLADEALGVIRTRAKQWESLDSQELRGSGLVF